MKDFKYKRLSATEDMADYMTKKLDATGETLAQVDFTFKTGKIATVTRYLSKSGRTKYNLYYECVQRLYAADYTTTACELLELLWKSEEV